MRINRLKLNNRGDTILEVLISVAVLSLILTTSFTLANRSSQATRQAGERGEATKFAQSELEKLKYFLSASGNPIGLPAPGTYFCIDTSGVIPSPLTLPSITDLNASNSGIDAKCKHGTESRYATFIHRGPNPNLSNTYTVYVRWDSVTGRGVDKVDLIHRIYPVIASNIASIRIKTP